MSAGIASLVCSTSDTCIERAVHALLNEGQVQMMDTRQPEESTPPDAAATGALTPKSDGQLSELALTPDDDDHHPEVQPLRKSDRERFYEKTRPGDGGCLLWTAGKNVNGGYGKFVLHGKTMGAHRVAWFLEHNEILSPDQFLLHSCGVPACVEITHLRIGTHEENMKDRAAHGRYNTSRGTNNPFARFTDLQVAHMRKMIAAGIDHPWIADIFGCSPSYVGLLAKGKLRTRPTSEPSPAVLDKLERHDKAEANRVRLSEIISVVHPDDEIAGEEWRPTAFEGYMVSSLGRVRGRTMKILKPYITVAGYAVVHCGKGNPRGVHSLVCEAWQGPCPSAGMHAAHYNGNPLDNTPSNLRWATPEENGQDRVRHGRVPRGVTHRHAKLMPEKAKAIRAQLPGPRGTIARLAREYGVCKTTITNIRDNIIWRE
jgi:hypothetical protein